VNFGGFRAVIPRPFLERRVHCGDRLRKHVGADILTCEGQVPMADKNRTTRIASRMKAHERLVALTLKIDRKMYRRLLGLRATGEKLRTHQEILRQALAEYLDRAGA
jgi:hypothetical protein